MMAVLSAHNIETFYGPVPALKGVNITLEAGSITCIIGANGAGKTTLLNTVAGLLDARFGEITFEATQTNRLSADQVADLGLILTPEGRQVFPTLSVRENLLLGGYRKSTRKNMHKNMAQVFHYFPRLKERETHPAGMLSGGEQQMLAIGRSLMSEPKVLLLDEPSLGLSPKFVREIYRVLSNINASEGLCICVAEQNAAIALDTAHFGYVMELGRIVLAGPSEELKGKDVLQESFLGHGSNDADKKRFRTKKRWR